MINLPVFRKTILFLGDLFLLYLALIITLIVSFGQNFSSKILTQHLLPFSLLFLIWLLVFLVFDFYELDLFKSKTSFLVKIAIGLSLCLMIGVLFFYLMPFFGISPKSNFLILILILWVLLVL